MNYKEEFIAIYNTHIRRDGADKLLAWLENAGFYNDPASTRYHGSFPGGLVEHSVNVYKWLKKLVDACHPDANKPTDETVAIVALLHDTCKTGGYYGVEYRNRKNEAGQWEKYPAYVVNDPIAFGHGEGSVYIIEKFMKLTREEAMAIRWHMGFSDVSFKGGDGTISRAFGKFPLAVLVHTADLMATYFDENENLKKEGK